MIVIMDVYHCTDCDCHFASEHGKTEYPWCPNCDDLVTNKVGQTEVKVPVPDNYS